jgi:hypothetical protein
MFEKLLETFPGGNTPSINEYKYIEEASLIYA